MILELKTDRNSHGQFCDDNNETLGYSYYDSIQLFLDLEDNGIIMHLKDNREDNDSHVLSVLTAEEAELLAVNLLKLAELRKEKEK